MPSKPKKRPGGRSRQGVDEILAVAIAGGMAPKTAASKFDLSMDTVYRRLKSPKFIARVQEIRAEMLTRAVGQTAALLEAAGTRLAQLLQSRNEAIALGAVREVYASHLKMRDQVEIAERLRKVEERLGLVAGVERATPATEAAAEEEPDEG